MKKLLFFACLTLAFASCKNEGTETEPEMEPETVTSSDAEITGLKIAYVEVDSLMTQYQFCIDYNMLLNKKGENAQVTLQQKQRALQEHAAALQKKYENDGFTTRDELERAQNQLAKEQQDLASLEQRLMAELGNEQAQLTMELRDSIQAFLKTYNKSKKFDYIFSRQGDNILLANKRFDITKEVVAGLNKRYKAKADVKSIK